MSLPVPPVLGSPAGYDAVMFAVPHSQYAELDLAEWICDKSVLVLDAYMVFTKEQRQAYRCAGVRIEAIGIGDGL